MSLSHVCASVCEDVRLTGELKASVLRSSPLSRSTFQQPPNTQAANTRRPGIMLHHRPQSTGKECVCVCARACACVRKSESSCSLRCFDIKQQHKWQGHLNKVWSSLSLFWFLSLFIHHLDKHVFFLTNPINNMQCYHFNKFYSGKRYYWFETCR